MEALRREAGVEVPGKGDGGQRLEETSETESSANVGEAPAVCLPGC